MVEYRTHFYLKRGLKSLKITNRFDINRVSKSKNKEYICYFKHASIYLEIDSRVRNYTRRNNIRLEI